MWISQLGNGLSDWAQGISADEFGSIYVTGTDWQPGLLQDAYLVKYSSVPEPTSFALAIFLIPLLLSAIKPII